MPLLRLFADYCCFVSCPLAGWITVCSFLSSQVVSGVCWFTVLAVIASFLVSFCSSTPLVNWILSCAFFLLRVQRSSVFTAVLFWLLWIDLDRIPFEISLFLHLHLFIYLLCVCMCAHVHVCHDILMGLRDRLEGILPPCGYSWGSENSLRASIHHTAVENGTQLVRHGSQHLCPLSIHVSPLH